MDKESAGCPVAVNGSVFKSRSLPSGILQEPMLASAQVSIFINDLTSVTMKICTWHQPDCKMDMLEGRDAIKWDIDRLEELSHGNLMKLNKAKYKMLHLGRGNHQY